MDSTESVALPAGMTGFDIAVILIFLVGAIWGYNKGIVHTILFIGAWTGAVLVTIYGYTHLQPYVHQLIRIPFIADVTTAGVLFIGGLVLFLMATKHVSKRVQDSALGVFDRILGFGFGVLSLTILFSLAYIAMGWIFAPDELPGWIAEARTLPLIADGADVLRSLAPEDFTFADTNDTDTQLTPWF